MMFAVLGSIMVAVGYCASVFVFEIGGFKSPTNSILVGISFILLQICTNQSKMSK